MRKELHTLKHGCLQVSDEDDTQILEAVRALFAKYSDAYQIAVKFPNSHSQIIFLKEEDE